MTDLEALARMTDIAFDILSAHTFGRCSCSAGTKCRGTRLYDIIGARLYDALTEQEATA